MKFEVGDLVTFKFLKTGQVHNRPDRIFQIILCKEERCTLKQLHSGRVQRINYLYRMLRKLTDAERILYASR